MNYLSTRYRRRPARVMAMPAMLPAMGDLSSVIGTAIDVASDPYLPEVFCRIQQLKNIDHGEAVTICAETPAGTIGGVGLANAMIPLRAYVYAQQNKWVYPVAIAAILGIPLLIGYKLGENSK